MKNGSISEQFELQEQEIQSSERKTEINQDSNQENLFSINLENKEIDHTSSNTGSNIDKEKDDRIPTHQSNNQENYFSSDSLVSLVPFGANLLINSNVPEEQIPISQKRKKKYRKL